MYVGAAVSRTNNQSLYVRYMAFPCILHAQTQVRVAADIINTT